jgi:hypothetical protein
MQNFINNHRRLALFLFVVASIALVSLIIIATINGSNTTNTSDTSVEAPQVGDNDTDQLLYYVSSIYTITQDENDNKHISITAYPGYRTSAVNELIKLGLNPTDYNITFDYESPFKRYE